MGQPSGFSPLAETEKKEKKRVGMGGKHSPLRYCQLKVLRPKWDALAERWHCLLHAYRFLPNLERLSTEEPIVDRLHEVAAETKEILCEAVKREKPLSLRR